MDIPDEVPEYLTRLGAAFAASRVFHSALELDLFTRLERPMTALQIRQLLSLHPRSIPHFLDCLVSLKLLQRSGQGEGALYSNTLDTAKFLSRNSEFYAGAMLYSFATRNYKSWVHLTVALQTGEPQNEAHPRNEGGEVWESIFSRPEKVKNFTNAMVAHNGPSHRMFARTFDFKDVGVVLDVGGGSGQLCCEIARENEHLRCLCLELSYVCPVGRENIRSQGLERRVEMIEGSCWTTAYEKVDLLVYSHVFHCYDDEKKRFLLQKAYDALSEGGRVVVIDIFIDEKRCEALEALLMSIHMLIVSEGGSNCIVNELIDWSKEIGFKEPEVMKLRGPTSAVIQRK